MRVELESSDGSIISDKLPAQRARELFYFFVRVYLEGHHEIRAIRLFDNANRLYKSYIQKF